MELLKPTRRGFMGLLTGVVSFFAAPAIVRASSIMPIKAEARWLWVSNEALREAQVVLRGQNLIRVEERFGRDMVLIQNDAAGKVLMRAMRHIDHQFEPVIALDKAEWHFTQRDSFDRINGVGAPDSWE